MSLINKVSKSRDLKVWEGEFPVQYLYTCGIAGEVFFREIKDNGKLKGLRCHQCGKVYVPPSIYCEECFNRLDEWVDVGNQGHLYSFTRSHLDRVGKRLEEPALLGAVNMDHTEGVLIHRLGEVEFSELKIGMRMEVVFKKPSERKGSILDISHFRPLE